MVPRRVRRSGEQVGDGRPPLPTAGFGTDEARGRATRHRDLDLLALFDPTDQVGRVLTQLPQAHSIHRGNVAHVLARVRRRFEPGEVALLQLRDRADVVVGVEHDVHRVAAVVVDSDHDEHRELEPVGTPPGPPEEREPIAADLDGFVVAPW